MNSLQEKKAKLISILSEQESLLVAFSGGVDSTFLLSVAYSIFGRRLLAVTASSPVHPEKETRAARDLARSMGVRHTIIQSKEMGLPDFRRNPPDRCYQCKVHLFGLLLKMAAEEGLACVVHGANLDDLDDYRPGMRAAREMQVRAPLVEAGLTKADIRELSRDMSLETWDKPAMACLASRFPHGTILSAEKLAAVEQAEEVLHELGFRHCRVRHHGNLARIEVAPADFPDILKEMTTAQIVRRLRDLGFVYVSLDLEGYTQGSMNPEGVQPV